MNVVWEEPPPPARSRKPGVWVERLAPLKGRPGAWARIEGSYNLGTVTHLRKGRMVGVDPKEFEFRQVMADGLPGGHVHIFARFIGDER